MDERDFVSGLERLLDGIMGEMMDAECRRVAKETGKKVVEATREAARNSSEFDKRQVLFYSEIISVLEKEVERIGLDGGIEVRHDG